MRSYQVKKGLKTDTEVRNQPILQRLEKPTKLAKAKTIGYKAKQGYIVVRVRNIVEKKTNSI